MLANCMFKNDNQVVIHLPENNSQLTKFSFAFPSRINAEKLFRRLTTFLLNNGFIDKNKNIIDSGAFIGDNALPWAKNINGIVYAIDPSQANCEYIKRLAKLNNVKNIKVYQEALSDSEAFLNTNQDIEHCEFKKGNSGNSVVKSVTLDSLAKRGLVRNVSFIHLDVEGMEHEVISGAQKLIDKQKPIISFEQHLRTDNYQALILSLHKKGYTSYLINELLAGCRDDCRNFFAFPDTFPLTELIPLIDKYVEMSDVYGAMEPYNQPLIPVNIVNN